MSAVSQGFTCVTCRLVFPNSAQQKEHYVSEWHRYNAKRNVVGLPPISEESFQSKTSEQKKEETETNYCKHCGKLFQSKNSYDNHLNSKKHKTNLESLSTPLERPRTKVTPVTTENEDLDSVRFVREERIEDDSASSGGWETDSEEEYDFNEEKAVPCTGCLFCAKTSSCVEDNVTHMYERHGFFVPDVEYCSDICGLLTYLGMKVGAGSCCIKCSKKFPDIHSVQLHMKDKIHVTFSLDENLVDYLDFYDYGSLLAEDDSDDDNVALDLGYTLVLPSGAKLGHRSLMRYFKQRLRSDEDQKRLANARLAMKSKLEQKALGWTGVSGLAAIQRARDFKFVRRVMQKKWLDKGIHSNKLHKSRGRDDQM